MGAIHIVQASQMKKINLIYLVFGEENVQHIYLKIPNKKWEDFHPPSHVEDTRTGEIVNIIEKGIENGVIYK